jgi:RNA polymerase sigma factor (sigma-70 family)
MLNGEPGCGLRAPRESFLVPQQEPSDRELLDRFARHQDGAAFGALVHRHGPMVLGVCRRALGHAQDAEDAFQATFLVLVRKARALGRPELLAGWLYGVAYRIARKARARALRHREHERRAAVMPRAEPRTDPDWQDVRTALDQELNQLPEKYRAPLVLCYLEGKTNAEAARLLGWPAGSMSARLARARELLRERLEGRRRTGVLSVGVLVMLLSREVWGLPLPEQLAEATVRAALGLARGVPAASLVSPSVRDLLAAMLRTLRAAQLRRVAVIMFATVALVTVGLVGSPLVGGPDLLGLGTIMQPASSGGGCSH